MKLILAIICGYLVKECFTKGNLLDFFLLGMCGRMLYTAITYQPEESEDGTEQ